MLPEIDYKMNRSSEEAVFHNALNDLNILKENDKSKVN